MSQDTITVETYRDIESRIEEGFLDIWLSASLLGENGQEYFTSFSPTRQENGDMLRLDVSVEPISYFTTPTQKVIQRGEIPEVDMLIIKPQGTLRTELSSSAYTVNMAGAKVICSPPIARFQYDGKECALDLTFKSKGKPIWWNEGKPEGARTTPSTVIHGVEILGDVEGSLTIGGEETQVKGSGIHEVVSSPHQAWWEYGWMDWIWFDFPELHGLIFEMQGGRYKEGSIYLMEEKEYLVINDFDIDHPQWAYSPVLQHPWPIEISARAKTDKGILFIEGKVLRSQTWKQINKYRHAMTLPASDMEVRWTSGTFTYNDGRIIPLSNGRGGDEIIAVYNFAQ